MKTKQTILKAFASAALAIGAYASADAQTNLGASCGCPVVGSRTEVTVSSLPGYTAIAGTYGGELTSGAVFTCDKTYILDKKIYIPAGQTLTIAPGTLIKGATAATSSEATALVIERGGDEWTLIRGRCGRAVSEGSHHGLLINIGLTDVEHHAKALVQEDVRVLKDAARA